MLLNSINSVNHVKNTSKSRSCFWMFLTTMSFVRLSPSSSSSLPAALKGARAVWAAFQKCAQTLTSRHELATAMLRHLMSNRSRETPHSATSHVNNLIFTLLPHTPGICVNAFGKKFLYYIPIRTKFSIFTFLLLMIKQISSYRRLFG